MRWPQLKLERLANQLVRGVQMEKARPTVCIVGAGLAGLSAAKTLTDVSVGDSVGFDVIVLEASDRIGGRLHTVYDVASIPIELGAQWLHGTRGNPLFEIYNRILQESPLATLSETQLQASRPSQEERDATISQQCYYDEHGVPIDRGEVDRCIAYVADAITSSGKEWAGETDSSNRLQNTDQHVRRKLLKLGLDHRTMNLAYQWRSSLECSISGCPHPGKMSPAHFNVYQELEGPDVELATGYNAIVQDLCKYARSCDILTNKIVKSIRWSFPGDAEDEKVTVECVSGEMFHVDHVILTVSLGVLQRSCLFQEQRMPEESVPSLEGHHCGINNDHVKGVIEFDPPLPPNKLHIIQRMGFGCVEKIFLVYDEPWWERHGLTYFRFLWRPRDAIGTEDAGPFSDRFEPTHWVRGVFGIYPVTSGNAACDLEAGATPQFISLPLDEQQNLAKRAVLCVWLTDPLRISVPEPHCSNSIYEISDEQLEVDISDAIKLFTQVRAPRTVAIHRSQWGMDPNYLGTYSYLADTSQPSDMEELSEPLCTGTGNRSPTPRVLFAGEATSPVHFSTAHGAYTSGITQAQRLIDTYRRT